MTIRLRNFDPTDTATLATLATRSYLADDRPIIVTPEQIEEEFCPPNVSVESDVFIAVEGVEVLGYSFTYMVHNPDGDQRCFIFGHVDPEHRRRGVGTLLMNRACARARDVLASSPCSGNSYLRTDCSSSSIGAQQLFSNCGMTPVRWFSDLMRPLEPPLAIEPPSEIAIVSWPIDHSEELRQMKNAAFADHWGSTPTSIENWEQLTNGWSSRLDLSFVAMHEDEPIGLLLTHRYPSDDDITGGRYGWIDKLATVSAWRGCGVASSLIAHALDAYRRDGLTHAALDVDSTSQTGANRLYERLGFRASRTTVMYSLTVEHDRTIGTASS